jgi:hypothetical protein
MKTAGIILTFIFLRLHFCVADENPWGTGLISPIVKQQYRSLEWKVFKGDVKQLDGVEVHITGYLHKNPYVLDGGRILAIYEFQKLTPERSEVCLIIPDVYQPKLKNIKPGTKVEFYGALFTKPIGPPIGAYYYLIRVDAIIPAK